MCDALKGLDSGRKCFRMIGGVLVERTVGEVLPTVDANRQQIAQVVKMLKDQFEDAQRKIAAFKEKHGVTSGGGGGGGGAKPAEAGPGKAGVLV